MYQNSRVQIPYKRRGPFPIFSSIIKLFKSCLTLSYVTSLLSPQMVNWMESIVKVTKTSLTFSFLLYENKHKILTKTVYPILNGTHHSNTPTPRTKETSKHPCAIHSSSRHQRSKADFETEANASQHLILIILHCHLKSVRPL